MIKNKKTKKLKRKTVVSLHLLIYTDDTVYCALGFEQILGFKVLEEESCSFT